MARSGKGQGGVGGSAPAPQRRQREPSRAAGRKLIAFEPEMLQALTLLARDRMQSFQELADEAFADLLRKHGRPASLQQALRRSLGEGGAGAARAREGGSAKRPGPAPRSPRSRG